MSDKIAAGEQCCEIGFARADRKPDPDLAVPRSRR
jgi:hypothetical protein